MKVPLAKPFYDEREEIAVAPVIRSGWVSQGPKVAEFERRLADWIGVEHAVATNSCTSAMQIALHLSGVGPGDDVLCPSFTCMATANAILQVGARPQFVDIDARTFNMDPPAVAAAVTRTTRAIMVVHQIGLPADLDALTAIARGARLKVVEDAGCALGAAYRGRRIGSTGSPACFSLHPRKTISTGEGGVLTTGDADFAARARAYRSHGASVSSLERHEAGGLLYGQYFDVGHNFRFTDIQAAIGLVQIGKIDEILRRKADVADHYTVSVAALPHVLAPLVPDGCRHAWQSYLVILGPESPIPRDEVIQRMGERGITCLRGIAPLHREPVFAGMAPVAPLDRTEDAYGRTVFLPIYAAMTREEIDHVVTSFAEVVADSRS
jgi:dTDP-4-amino-4,6-dideoxygalactose transaminase